MNGTRGLFGAAVVALTIAGIQSAAAAPDAPPVNWLTMSGPYVGAHGGYFWGNANLSENGVASGGGTFNGFIGGALAGYNFLLSNQLMLGIEADVGVSNAHGNGIASTDSYVYDLNHNAHLRALLGFPVGSARFFVAAGAAFADVHLGEVKTWDYTGTFTGWTAGVGVDAPLGNNMFGRVELLYDDYGTKSYDMGKGMTCDGAITAVTLRAALVYQFGQPN